MNHKIKKELHKLGYQPTATKIRLSDCSIKLLYLITDHNTRKLEFEQGLTGKNGL